MSDTRNGLTFDAWKAAVNAELIDLCGTVADDLPDYDYWVACDSGMDAAEAAQAALDAAGLY